MAKSQQKKGGGGRKIGRTKRKAERRGSPLSLFVRDRITGSEYFRLTGQRQ